MQRFLSRPNLSNRNELTFELLIHYGYTIDGKRMCEKNFMKHFELLKSLVKELETSDIPHTNNLKNSNYLFNDIRSNLIYKLCTSDIFYAPWMTIDLVMDIELVFNSINCIVNPKIVAKIFPLKDLLKYGIEIIENPDINNIIHHLPTILFDVEYATWKLSLANLNTYFMNYTLSKFDLQYNKSISLKEAFKYECDIDKKLHHTLIQDIPYDCLSIIKKPKRIKDITVRIYELFLLKRYDHIHRIYTEKIDMHSFNDVDFTF
ncbi:hypothetical protein D3C87_906960 [compost metagenome]